MSQIFVQLNTRSGMAFFYDAKLPDDALENTPPGTIFIPIDQHAMIEGNQYTLDLTDWFVIRYLFNGTQHTKIVTTDNILEYLRSSGMDQDVLISLDRLSVSDFEGTPFYIDLGVKYDKT